MSNSPAPTRFPEVFANLDYDIFEEFADGSTVWRACVLGIASAELRLRELSRESNNKFFALNLQDRTQPILSPKFSLHASTSPARRNLRRAG